MNAHQAEFSHAGVWFKDAATFALAQAIGGAALHIVADTDTLKHDSLAIPRIVATGEAHVELHPLVRAAGPQCAAQVGPPDVKTLAEALAWAKSLICWESVFDEWASAARIAAGNSSTVAQWFAAAQETVGREFGVDVPTFCMSSICRGVAWAHFVAELALRFEEMFEIHAHALTQHRAALREKNPAQPVPDLKRAADALELPLWAYRDESPREPVYAVRKAGVVHLRTPSGPLLALPADGGQAAAAVMEAARQRILIAPRALTLTMFLRTFVADVFIHGTGGATLRRRGGPYRGEILGLAAAAIHHRHGHAASALAPLPVANSDLSQARWRMHHAWHNPLLYADKLEQTDEVRALAEKRRQLLGQMEQLERLNDGRANAFAELVEVNAKLRRLLSGVVERPRRQLETMRRELEYNAVIASREYFFALMGRDKLIGLANQARQWAVPLSDSRCKTTGQAADFGGDKKVMVDRDYRLRSPRRITELFESGTRAEDSWGMMIGAEGTPGSPPQMAFAVGRRHGGAVQRNRMRRLCREAFRQVRGDLPGAWDLVFVPRAKRPFCFPARRVHRAPG